MSKSNKEKPKIEVYMDIYQSKLSQSKRETFSIKLVSPNSFQSQINKVIDNLKGSPQKKKKKIIQVWTSRKTNPYYSLINSN